MYPQRKPRVRNRQRSLCSETLEPRFLLANDFPFQNPIQPFDVNRDLRVTALDALQVINFVGRNGPDFQLPQTNDGERFLSKKLIDLATTNQIPHIEGNRYGFGWRPYEDGSFSHSGRAAVSIFSAMRSVSSSE